MTLIDPRSFSPKDFLSKVTRFGIKEQNGARLLGAVLGKGHLDPQKWLDVGIINAQLANTLDILPELKLEKLVTSSVDGFQKILFKTEDNLNIETVIIPLQKENNVTVCLSSQVGCVMGCTFCATAKMSKRRNLKAWEIIDQFRQARAIAEGSGGRVTGAVFMGMGEPFLNYKNVMQAAESFCYPVFNAISAKAITISTVGILDKINRFTEEKRPFRLSISLGAATDAKRQKFVPIAAKTPIKSIIAAARRHSLFTKERIMLSYVCIGNENIFPEDAEALAELVGDTQIRLDLIEVTDPTNLHRRPTEEEMSLFRDALNTYLKQPVVRRYSGGADISAACGTLAGKG
ncbi:UNVERIFIED_CONTAM: hypothetical protein GTU68_048835 [Idotea baltica]|nr:hypothetical protein [Idotea baltica]